MANTIELKQQIAQGEYDAAFAKLYGADAVQEQRKRYTDLIDEFEKKYGTNRTVRLYSAPGRTEIGGNHTDHNNGVVLAGSVNLDMVAVVSPNEENVIRVKSLGFDKIDDVDVTNLVPQPREAEHSASLIRGVAKGIVDAGGKVGGFDCYTTSNVLRGSGLSSSAAFEVCIGAILRGEYNNNDMEKFNQVKIAQIGQFAENVFFGKPCGLMDQAAVCLGGLAYMDFEDQAQPKTQKLELNFEDHGYALVLVKVGADHVAATDDYAAVPREMQDVAAEFGKARLCEVDVADFDAKLPELRAKLGDRACLRAVHYWYENGQRQGLEGRGKEIYDPESDGWYWLDSDANGAKAVSKDVYQESNGGKWVRYDANGHMIKGWDTNDDGTYYFDLITGAMAKGDIVVDNLPCSFDTTTGIGCNLMWHSMDGKDYWYEAGKRQGYDPNNAAYRGKEIYDPASDAWYWLDNVQQGAKAVSKDVYQESSGGKWVRYDANGQMIKGWNTNENGTYYFDLITGAMAHGTVEINGKTCHFDEATGILK